MEMGERCYVGFQDEKGKEIDLTVYLHWDGPIEDVYAMCRMARLLGYRSTDDPSYMAARFVFLAGCSTGSEDGLSVGLFPDPDHVTDTDYGRYVIGKDWRIVDWRSHYGKEEGKRVHGEWVPKAARMESSDDALRILNDRLPDRARVPPEILEDYIAGVPLEECRVRLEGIRREALYRRLGVIE